MLLGCLLVEFPTAKLARSKDIDLFLHCLFFFLRKQLLFAKLKASSKPGAFQFPFGNLSLWLSLFFYFFERRRIVFALNLPMLGGVEGFSFRLKYFLANLLMLLDGIWIEHSATAHSTLM
jgi:hypothetical protein